MAEKATEHDTIAHAAAAGKADKSGADVILAIRLRGACSVNKEAEDTMRMLGLKRRHSAALLEKNDSTLGMIRKIDSFITWGEASPEIAARLKSRGQSFGLKPPVKGLKSIKLQWPEGDLGYRGEAINELVRRMM